MSLLSKQKLQPDPFTQFAEWFEDAKEGSGMQYPEAMCVSNIGKDGYPDSRMVLLKSVDERGFVFYTNLDSPNKKEYMHSSKMAITFYWPGLRRQVRVQGETELVSKKEADDYFTSRPRLSQLGAWASDQSEVLDTRATLVKKVAKYAVKFAGKPVPRPPHWTGVRIIPKKVEFWQDQKNRLHDRFLYTRHKSGKWEIKRLYP